MKPPVPLLKSTSAGLREIMRERGMTITDVAKGCGLSSATVRFQMNAAVPVTRSTWKIERFLGAAIWTEQQRFADLVRASDFLGTDFVFTKFHALRSAAVAKGVPDTRTLTNKDALLARVLAHLAETKTHAST